MLIHSYVCSTICTWKYFCPFSCWILHVNVTYFNGFYFFRLEFCKNIISSCTIHLCLCLIHRHMVLKKRRPSLYRVFSLKFFKNNFLQFYKTNLLAPLKRILAYQTKGQLSTMPHFSPTDFYFKNISNGTPCKLDASSMYSLLSGALCKIEQFLYNFSQKIVYVSLHKLSKFT